MVGSTEDRWTVLAARADAAAEKRWDHQIAETIVGGRTDDADRQRLADAFRFHTRERADNDQRFGPMVTFASGASVPAPLAQIGSDTCELWDQVQSRAAHPRVVARLRDLLYERRWGDVGAHLTGAVHAYMQYGAAIDPPTLEAVDAFRRAHHLARLGRQADLIERATAELLRVAQASLDDVEPKPGITLRLLEVLVEHRCADEAVDRLLDQARRHFTAASNAESVIELQRRRARNDTERKRLDRQLVERWLEEAEAVDPLVAVLHREKAAKLARERGLPELVERAITAMQSAGRPELAHIKVEVPSSLSVDQIQEYIASMAGDSWWDCIMSVLSHGPPTGDVERNRKTAADLARDHPLQALFPKVRLGGDGLPRYSPQSEDDTLDDQLADIESMNMQWHGALMAEALRRAGATFMPTTEDVVEALASVECHSGTAELIARTVLRFNGTDYEGAVYTGIPVVERLCRDLLLAVDAPLYRVQRERAPGTYPGLGAMLPQLAARGLDESWYRFLRTYLSAPNGWNLRNEALHGFVDNVDVLEAGLVLIGILYLTLVRPRPSNLSEPQPSDP